MFMVRADLILFVLYAPVARPIKNTTLVKRGVGLLVFKRAKGLSSGAEDQQQHQRP